MSKAAEQKGIADGIPVYCSFEKIAQIESIVPNPRNPNRHGKDQLELMAKVIAGQGWRSPITVSRRSGFIVRGHGRLEAAKRLGVKEVPVDTQDYATEAEELADLVADNRLAEMASNDTKALLELLEELDTGWMDVELTGFTQRDIESMILTMTGGKDQVSKNEDEVPDPPKDPTSKPGELYELGRHRLIVGDSTDKATIFKLMGGARADCVFTDPPYGVSYQTQSGKFDKIKNDELTGDSLAKKLLIPAFKNMVAVAKDEAGFYVWHASSTRDDFSYALKAAGISEKRYLIWAKDSFVLGHADYHWAHEPCFYGGKEGHEPAFFGDRTNQTVWRAMLCRPDGAATTLGSGIVLLDGAGAKIFISPKAAKGKKVRTIRLTPGSQIDISHDDPNTSVWQVSRETGTVHPTQKPVELVRRALENSTEPGGVVVDLFGGSGATLIGAEMTGRCAYLCELDPIYADVINERFKAFTGKEVRKIE
jgi:DNA modification methylase